MANRCRRRWWHRKPVTGSFPPAPEHPCENMKRSCHRRTSPTGGERPRAVCGRAPVVKSWRATEPVRREDAMDVGLQMIFASYGWSNVPDDQAWDEELRLAR